MENTSRKRRCVYYTHDQCRSVFSKTQKKQKKYEQQKNTVCAIKLICDVLNVRENKLTYSSLNIQVLCFKYDFNRIYYF